MTFEAKIVKPIHSYIIDCIEPSDLSYDSDDNSFYCVSDEGYIFHYNFEGQTIRSKELDLRDIESIYVDSKFIYVVDERTRQVVILDKLNFKELNRKVVNYFGGANKGYEGITFNPKKDKSPAFKDVETGELYSSIYARIIINNSCGIYT